MTDIAKGLNAKGGKNTHRFQSKADRVASVRVDVSRRIERTAGVGTNAGAVPDAGEHGSFFFDELERMRHLYATPQYMAFYREVQPRALSMALLLHHRTDIVDALLCHLQRGGDAPQVGPLLELVGTLARDLRHHFMPFFGRVLTVVLRMVDDEGDDSAVGAASPERVGEVFRAVGLLFKYLSKPLRKDMAKLRQFYAPLMGHRKDFVRRFAAETVAPLLRKLSDEALHKHSRGLLKAVGRELPAEPAASSVIPDRAHSAVERAAADVAADEDLDEDEDENEDEPQRKELRNTDAPARGAETSESLVVDGLAQLLFHLMKGVRNQLHSRAPALLRALLQSLSLPVAVHDHRKKGKQRQAKGTMSPRALEAVHGALRHICEFTRAQHCEAVWNELFTALNGAVAAWAELVQETPSAVVDATATWLCWLVSVLQMWIQHRGGSRVGAMQHAPLIALLTKLTASPIAHGPHATSAQGLRLKRAVIDLVLCCTGTDWKGPLLAPNAQTSQASIMAVLESVFDVGPHIHSVDCCACVVNASQKLLDGLGGDYGNARSFIPIALNFCKRLLWHEDKSIAVGGSKNRRARRRSRSRSRSCDGLEAQGDIVTPHRTFAFVLLADITTAARAVTGAFGAGVLPDITADGLLRFPRACAQDDKQSPASMLSQAMRLGSSGQPAKLWCVLRCVEHVDVEVHNGKDNLVKSDELFEATQHVADALERRSGASDTDVNSILMGQSYATLLSLLRRQRSDTEPSKRLHALCARIERALHCNPGALPIIAVADSFVEEVAHTHFDDVFEDSRQRKWADMLQASLSSRSQRVRSHATRILARFPPLQWTRDDEQCDCPVIQICAEIGELEISLDTERDFTRRLQTLDVLSRTATLPTMYARLLAHFLLGLLNNKFSTIWTHATATFATLLESHAAVVWPILAAKLRQVESQLEQPATKASDVSEERTVVRSPADAAAFSRFDAANLEQQADADLGTDEDKFHEELWKLLCLNNVPHLVGQRSTEVVQVFFRFLRRQYFVIHTDHLELDALDLGCDADDSQITNLPRPVNVQNRLKRYLGLFAAIKNGKGLHEQRRLERVFVAFLTHADWTVAKLCAQALLQTKAAYLTPYREHLLDISEPSKFREALLRFPLGRDAGVLAHAHRADALPIIMRLLYGKLTARHVGGGKKPQSPSARRATVLAHMASCEDTELTFLMKLVLRPFDLRGANVSRATYHRVNGSAVAGVAATRQIGFLRLATDMVKHMHTKLDQYLHTLSALVAALLHDVVAKLDSKSDEFSRDDTRQYVMVRGLCFRFATELLSQFPEHDFGLWAADFLPALMNDALRLPSVMKGAQQPSALLLCLKAVCDRTELVPIVHRHTPQILPITLQCLSQRVSAGKNVVACALGVLDGALRHDETTSRKSERVLMGLLPDLLAQFCELFERGENDMTKGGRAAYERAREREGHLQFLVRASRFCADLNVEKVSESATLLANLLLQHIHPRARPRDTTAQHVLGIFEELVPLTRSPETYVLPLAQLFGPRGFKSQAPRRALCSSFRVVACSDGMVGQGWDSLAKTLDDMNAFIAGQIEEKADMGTRLDAIDRLNDGEMERIVLRVMPSQLRMQLSPLVQQLFHYLHDDELALRNNGAHVLEKMLEQFGGAISQRDAQKSEAKKSQQKKAKINDKDQRSLELSALMCDLVVPAIHFGIKSHSATTRRSFVSLLATTIRLFPGITSFHGDLACLCDVHDPESDFFNNIVHLQLHRRRRALARLRKLCETAARGETKMTLAQPSVVHILIPLVQHFIYELQKTTEQTTQDEAVQTFGALAAHMSWKPYSRSLLTMIKQIPRHPEQERSLVKAVCAMIDSFPLRITDADEEESEGGEEGSEGTPSMDTIADQQLPTEHDVADTDDKKSQGQSESEHSEHESDSEGESENESESESEDDSAAEAQRAKSTLAKKVVPMLRRFMVQSKRLNDGTWRNTIRPHVALATVKCLQLLGCNMLRSELPQLLKRVCDSLRSRDEQQRSSGHDAMVMMAAELGAQHLFKVLVALQNGLLAGYQVHVLSHTLHSILLRLSDVDDAKTESADINKATQHTEMKANAAFESGLQECLPPILGILMEDVFGESGAQKQEEQFKKKAKIKEAKGCRSYDSFELLAQTIQFLPNKSFYMLLEPVLQHLSQGSDGKGVGKAQEVLRRVAVGLLHNRSVDIETLLIYIHTLIKHHIGIGRNKGEGDSKTGETRHNSRNAVVPWILSDPSSRSSQSMRALDASLRQFQGMVQMAGVVQNVSTSNAAMGKTIKTASTNGSHSPILDSTMLHFALQLLHARLKRKVISDKDSAHLRMMEPFVPLLVAMMRRTKVARVQLLVLQCVQHTLHWPLPSWDSQLKALTTRVFDLLKPDSAASPELVQGAIKLLAAMLQRCEQLDLAMPQVRLLLSRIAVEIDGHGGGAGTAQNASFALLKAVVQRRFVVPEVYDLMDIVGRLLVTSDRAVVQQHCSGLFWRFLLEYPLSDRRVDRQLQYLLRNMNFEYEGGRRAVIGCLQSVVEKFPVAVLESRAQLLFMRLSLQLVQDETADCRQAAARALRTILKRVAVGTVHESVGIVTEWLNSDETEVFRTGVQVAGQIVEARPDTLKRWVPAFVSAVHTGLERAAVDDDAWDDAEEVTGEQDTGSRWQPVYYSLLLLEKLMSNASSTVCALLDGAVGAGAQENESQRAASSILPALSELCLLHEHFWVRIASSRIIGVYFAHHSPKITTDHERRKQRSTFLAGTQALSALAKRFCLQLQSKFLDDGFAEQVVKNLLFVTRCMHHDAVASTRGDDVDVDEDDHEHVVVAGRGAVEGSNEDDGDSEEFDAEVEDSEAARVLIEHDPLRWLFRRMSKLATAKGRTDRDCQRCAVFKWFAAVATQCDKRLTLRFLTAMLEPLQRATTYENEREHVKDLAQEVISLLEHRVTELAGATAFGNAYAAVQQQAATKRAARKRERALEAVMDPGAAATRKRRKHQASAERRKRKIEHFRMLKGSGGPATGHKRRAR